MGEDRLLLVILNYIIRTLTNQYYNQYNPLLFPAFILAPNALAPLYQLRASIQSNIALGFINKQAVNQVKLIYINKYRRFPMPLSIFINKKCCWQLAYLYNRTTPNAFQETLITDLLEIMAPLFILQRYRDIYSNQLIKRLRSMTKIVKTIYKSNMVQKRQAKATQGKVLMVYKLLKQLSILAEYTAYVW